MRIPEEMRQDLLALINTNFTGMVEQMMTLLLPETVDPELKQWLTTKAAGQERAPAIGLFRDLTALDLVPAFKEAGAPVRCVNSSGGYAMFRPTEIETNRKYADFDAVLIPDIGHYPMLENPSEFNRKLREVLNDLSTKRR
ncbi:MAG TPA: alpha/beta hydrolase [Verrucomicrobiota bacterium]|nr:alpha/beta hydrolase [Verrucomicrobiota bacterium]